MKQSGRVLLIAGIILFSIMMLNDDAAAQCAMCRAQAESSVQENSTAALGLNFAILYLFFSPFLVVAIVAFFWFRERKRANLEREFQIR